SASEDPPAGAAASGAPCGRFVFLGSREATMAKELQGLQVAFLATDGVEQVELQQPREAMERAGARTELISLRPGSIQAMRHDDKGDRFDVDGTVGEADPDDYDALVLPGGVANPDRLRRVPAVQRFVRAFFE